MTPVKPIPDGYHTVTPHLAIRGAAQAIAFYAKAFGAEESYRLPAPDGTVAHAEIRIGDSVVMLGEESPAMGATAPPTLGGSAVSLLLYVADVDAACTRATTAGCTVEFPPTDMFWGDRYAKLRDPFGHKWAIATHKEDVAPDEMVRRFAKM